MDAKPTVLVADDQPHIGEALRLLLKSDGFAVEIVSSPADVLKSVAAQKFDAVLMDLNYTRDTTSGEEGMDLLARLKHADANLPVVVMTAWGNMQLAVEAMRRGARDFVMKPWDNAELLQTMRAQVETGRTLRRSDSDRREHVKELADALQIQRRLLPQSISSIPGLEIAADWQPAHVVGGDYFDILKFSETRLGVCIADVSGKGMPAALLMANLQAAVQLAATGKVEPRDLCEALNRILCANSESGRFVTLFYGVFDLSSRRFTFVNAGHVPPVLERRDGAQSLLEEGGTILGEFPAAQFTQGEVSLQPGDRLTLYTDGVVEASSDAQGEFSIERLRLLLGANRNLSAKDLQEKVMLEVTRFADGHFQDDATVMIVSVG